MRSLLLAVCVFVLAIGFSCSQSSEEPSEVELFRIVLEESSMLVNDVYLLTNDSIVVSKKGPEGVEVGFSKKLNLEEMSEVRELLMSFNLDTLQKKYVDHMATDCDVEFDWKIKIDQNEFATRVYKIKVDKLFELTELMNEMLPNELKSAYNQDYLER
ncbi:MAG: hypothetical protein QNK23_18420 [Crocinitomicaceae bacterium]|nr:hypothetical protein [Crocinitomicaceae bacterium]